MMFPNIDGYISQFEDLARPAGTPKETQRQYNYFSADLPDPP